jgi:hypothetical protein
MQEKLGNGSLPFQTKLVEVGVDEHPLPPLLRMIMPPSAKNLYLENN